MGSPFEKAVPRAADPKSHTKREHQTSHRLDDARLDRREQAAERARRKATK